MPGSGTRIVWPGHLRSPGLGLCFRSWENGTELALLHYRAASPIRAATTLGAGEPDLRTRSLSPVPATSAQWAASRGWCFKLCVLLRQLLLKSNPQFSRVSQTRPYFSGVNVNAHGGPEGPGQGGRRGPGCSCPHVRSVGRQRLPPPLRSPDPGLWFSHAAAGEKHQTHQAPWWVPSSRHAKAKLETLGLRDFGTWRCHVTPQT